MKLDLNLLRVFGILMEVRSVSRAADRLGLTQSAVSHALGRLREQLDDPLFIRTGSGLRPTRRALEIAPAVRDGLGLLNEAVSRAAFEPGLATRSFTISAGSYFCVTLLPQVIQRARAEAPLARFAIVAPPVDPLAAFDDGTLDLALGSFRKYPPRLTSTLLFRERLVWVGRAGSGGDDLATRPRLGLVRAPLPARDAAAAVDAGFDQRIEFNQAPEESTPTPVTVYDPLSAGALIAQSDLVTRLPMHLAQMVTGRTRAEILAYCDEEPLALSMLWPTRLAADPAHLWLRGLLADAARDLDETAVADLAA